jgi:uncharacterized protein Yka (UPF0111/DUF47 family)
MERIWILDKLLPPKNRVFFDDFEKAADTCLEMAIFFEQVIVKGEITEEIIIKARHLKHKSSDIERETINRLNNTFITPIDREDIQILSSKLNKITKKMVQVCLNLNVYHLESYTEPIQQQAKTVLRACEELVHSVSLLKTISKMKEITESRSRMKEIEGYGDEIHYRAMEELYSGKFEAIEVIKLRDIYKDLENTLDNCFSVSEEILNIALKNN